MTSSVTASPTSSNSGTVDQFSQGQASVLNMAHIHKPFKNPKWQASKKTKNLKQIITMEKAKEYKTSTPTCKYLSADGNHTEFYVGVLLTALCISPSQS